MEVPRGWAERMMDAVMAMCRGASGPGGERHMVHVVEQGGRLQVLGGGPLGAGEAGMVGCDCSRVLCRRDHGLVHEGWTLPGDVKRTLTSHRPAA